MRVTSGRIVLLLLATWTTGCIAPSRAERSLEHLRLASQPSTPGKSIYVIRHGWHTGIAIKHSEISEADWPESRYVGDARFIEVGWGDASYLCAKLPNPLVLVNAAIVPSRSAIHVSGFQELPTRFFPDSQIIEIKISEEQMSNLCGFIHDSYRCASSGVTQLGPSLYGDGGVFLAIGRYFIPNTCNVWTAKALVAADCPVAIELCTMAPPLMIQARRHGFEIQKKPLGLPVFYPFMNFDRPRTDWQNLPDVPICNAGDG